MFAVTGTLLALLAALLHPGKTELMFYLWIVLKALGAAAFLYICVVGLLCIYYDLRVWMIRRSEARPKG